MELLINILLPAVVVIIYVFSVVAAICAVSAHMSGQRFLAIVCLVSSLMLFFGGTKLHEISKEKIVVASPPPVGG